MNGQSVGDSDSTGRGFSRRCRPGHRLQLLSDHARMLTTATQLSPSSSPLYAVFWLLQDPARYEVRHTARGRRLEAKTGKATQLTGWMTGGRHSPLGDHARAPDPRGTAHRVPRRRAVFSCGRASERRACRTPWLLLPRMSAPRGGTCETSCRRSARQFKGCLTEHTIKGPHTKR